MVPNKDYIDSTDYKQPLKTIIDWSTIPPIDLKSGKYQVYNALIQVLNFTLKDSPFNPLSEVQGLASKIYVSEG